jgi:predicted XRE-type DNA-binding protein
MKIMASKKEEEIAVIKSSGNVFADIGLVNPERHLAKVELAHQINKIIEKRSLRQVEAAAILATTQPKVSDLSCGHLAGFSIERLIGFLNKLDRDVEILVKERLTRPRTNGHLKVQCT